MIARKYKEAHAVKWIEYELVNNAGLIVNTTSLGMIGYPTLPISLERVKKSTKVYDIVYNPLETKLIKDAKKQKLEYVTGLSMFLGQAQESFRIWFNIKPSLSYYLISKLKKYKNVMIIIGLTGSVGAKTETSKFFKRNNVPVFDSDYQVKRIYKKKVINKIKTEFPEAFINNILLKEKLAEIVFEDSRKLEVLEKLSINI